MRNKITTGRKFMFAALLTLALAVFAAAQKTSFNVGERVETSDGRTGVIESFKPDMAKIKFDDGTTRFYMRTDLKKVEPPKPVRNEPQETFRVGDAVVWIKDEGKRLTVESISGDTAVLRYGPGNYNLYKNVKLEEMYSLKAWERMQNQENEQKLQRAALEDEAEPFMNTIWLLASSFNPKITQQGGSFSPTPATYEKWRKDLEALAAACQKYPNVTNSPLVDEPLYAQDVRNWHADWCAMARQRDTVIKNFLKYAGSDQTKYAVNSVQSLLNEAERNPDGYIGDELQTVLFDRAAWMKKNTQQYKTQFGLTDQDIEAKVFAPLAGKLGEVKAKIESDASNNAPTLPKFSDAALEMVVKRRVAANYPGAQVLKVGLDGANWSVRDGRRNIGSDSNGTEYYLRLKGAYRIKTGLALIRLPNQPYCQIRYIELTQPKKGAGFDAAWAMVETRGKFVKCQ